MNLVWKEFSILRTEKNWKEVRVVSVQMAERRAFQI